MPKHIVTQKSLRKLKKPIWYGNPFTPMGNKLPQRYKYLGINHIRIKQHNSKVNGEGKWYIMKNTQPRVHAGWIFTDTKLYNRDVKKYNFDNTGYFDYITDLGVNKYEKRLSEMEISDKNDPMYSAPKILRTYENLTYKVHLRSNQIKKSLQDKGYDLRTKEAIAEKARRLLKYTHSLYPASKEKFFEKKFYETLKKDYKRGHTFGGKTPAELMKAQKQRSMEEDYVPWLWEIATEMGYFSSLPDKIKKYNDFMQEKQPIIQDYHRKNKRSQDKSLRKTTMDKLVSYLNK